jgi:hypothetical protein
MPDDSLETQALVDAIEFHKGRVEEFKHQILDQQRRAENAEMCLSALIRGLQAARRFQHWNGSALGWIKAEDVEALKKELLVIEKLHDHDEVWWIALNGQNQIVGAYRTKEEAHANSSYVVGIRPGGPNTLIDVLGQTDEWYARKATEEEGHNVSVGGNDTFEKRRPDCENGDCRDHYGDSVAWCSKCIRAVENSS